MDQDSLGSLYDQAVRTFEAVVAATSKVPPGRDIDLEECLRTLYEAVKAKQKLVKCANAFCQSCPENERATLIALARSMLS